MWMTGFLILVAPGLAYAAAAAGFMTGGRLGRGPLVLIEGLVIAALAIAVAAMAMLAISGPGTSLLIGSNGICLSARLDAVSAVMLLLISFVGWVVVRFAETYLDGEAGHGRFVGRLYATVGCVMSIVVTGMRGACAGSRQRSAHERRTNPSSPPEAA
jgi:NAD(P)H-quinone oxidoreductase subunit 5